MNVINQQAPHSTTNNQQTQQTCSQASSQANKPEEDIEIIDDEEETTGTLSVRNNSSYSFIVEKGTQKFIFQLLFFIFILVTSYQFMHFFYEAHLFISKEPNMPIKKGFFN